MVKVETEDILLDQCKGLIEEKLQWGSSDLWTNQDFETLSEQILNETGVNLSPATLKRLWGKIKYTSKPTTTTLDTLAQFLGFENWREFRRDKSEQNSYPPALNGNYHLPDHSAQNIPAGIPKEQSTSKKWLIPAGVIIAGILLWTLLIGSDRTADRKGTIPGEIDKYSFASKKVVSEGVPNSVIFNYDASQASKDDNVFIQQSWDTLLRQRVDPVDHTHTSIYYYPGFFQAKLVVNNNIVKEHDLYIKTTGWLPLVEQSSVPVYFKEEDAIEDGVLSVPIAWLTSNNIPLQPVTPWVSFFNMRNFGELTTDDFILETMIRNDYNEGAGACQNTEIHLRLEGGVMMIPLSVKGCVSNLKIYGEVLGVDGKKNDLSGLGVDFSDWVKVKYEVKNKKGKIFINDNFALQTPDDYNGKKIAGIQFRFQGTGSVKYVKFSKSNGEVVYEDNFEGKL